MTAASFQDSLDAGLAGEQFLDEYFKGRGFRILTAPPAMQLQGVDRIFIDSDNQGTTIEYKTDKTAGRTHRAFVETVSVDVEGTPGWAYTSKADVLAYYIPDDGLVYVIRFSELRRRLSIWLKVYREVSIPNKGKPGTQSYKTRGILVPLHEFEQIAETVHSV